MFGLNMAKLGTSSKVTDILTDLVRGMDLDIDFRIFGCMDESSTNLDKIVDYNCFLEKTCCPPKEILYSHYLETLVNKRRVASRGGNSRW